MAFPDRKGCGVIVEVSTVRTVRGVDVAGHSSAGFWREAWLIVARGGWWKKREILDQVSDEISIEQAHNLLWCMVNRHRFLVTRGAGKNREYAVTSTCFIPKHLTAGDVVTAFTGQQRVGATP